MCKNAVKMPNKKYSFNRSNRDNYKTHMVCTIILYTFLKSQNMLLNVLIHILVLTFS